MTEQAPWRAQDKPMASTLRQVEAARRIRDGRIKVPYQCGRCQGYSVEPARAEEVKCEAIHCLKCGQVTTLATAKRMRTMRIKQIIAEGVDL